MYALLFVLLWFGVLILIRRANREESAIMDEVLPARIAELRHKGLVRSTGQLNERNAEDRTLVACNFGLGIEYWLVADPLVKLPPEQTWFEDGWYIENLVTEADAERLSRRLGIDSCQVILDDRLE
jgi:hypothetical protein